MDDKTPDVPLEMKAWLEGVEKKLERHGFDADAILEINARVSDMEQKASRPSMWNGGRGGVVSLGDQFANADGLKAFAEDRERPGRFKIETKAVLTAAADSAGATGAQTYRDDIVLIPKKGLSVRDLLPVIPVTSGSVEYPRQTARTNNAGMVAEGTLKPQSDYTFTMVTCPIRKIAHWTLASAEILMDAPQLAGILNTELLYGLAIKEDRQLLLGDGTGQNLTGLVPAATAYAAPVTIADANMIDKIGLAILQAALADFPADGIVMHPSDWTRIRLIKDADGKYLLGDPGAAVEPRLFGLPVVPTQGMTTDKFLVGQYTVAGTIYDRMSNTLLASTEDSDNFRKNLVTLLAEERVGLGIKQPGALIYGDFGNEA